MSNVGSDVRRMTVLACIKGGHPRAVFAVILNQLWCLIFTRCHAVVRFAEMLNDRGSDTPHGGCVGTFARITMRSMESSIMKSFGGTRSTVGKAQPTVFRRQIFWSLRIRGQRRCIRSRGQMKYLQRRLGATIHLRCMRTVVISDRLCLYQPPMGGQIDGGREAGSAAALIFMIISRTCRSTRDTERSSAGETATTRHHVRVDVSVDASPTNTQNSWTIVSSTALDVGSDIR